MPHGEENLVMVVVVICAAAMLCWRDARVAKRWSEALMAERNGTHHVVHATDCYQNARRGTKVRITWRQTGMTQDAWFTLPRVKQGTYLLIRGGSNGFGPHNRNPQVFYGPRPDRVLPAGAPQAWRRHQRIVGLLNRLSGFRGGGRR